MIDCIAVCGDSFGTGVGLPFDRRYEDLFGGLASSEYNLPLRVFARSGCCNMTIYLQVKKVIEQYQGREEKPLVLLSVTYHERYLIPIVDKIGYDDVDLKYINYIDYDPYSDFSDPRRKLEFEIADKPKFVSETLTNIALHLSGKPSGAGNRVFEPLPLEKYKKLMDYVVNIDNERVKFEYDNAIITKAHLLMKREDIPHIIMATHDDHYLHIDQKNVAIVNWGDLCRKYPDDMGTGHCDKNGHEEAFKILKPKIEFLLNEQKVSLL